MRLGQHSRHALRLATSVSALSLMAFAAPAAFAQDDTVDEPAADEIVVTGQRSSLTSAVERKQNAEEIVDSIVAIDIGKLPDVNVAEALQRISGVQISRNRGEGSGVAIRGLTQVRTELNGRDIFSTIDGRGLSWEDVPAELLAGIDVYKNPSAEQIEGGIGGLVNLRTRMPFDSAGRTISGAIQAVHYDLREKTGYNASALLSDRWMSGDQEFGFLFNLSYGKGYFREDAITIEPFFQREDFGNNYIASGAGISSWNGDRERLGGSLAFQYRPSADLEFHAMVLTSDYTFTDPQTGMFAYGAGDNGALTPVGDFTFDEDGTMLTGGFAGPPTQSFTRHTVRDSRTTDYSAGFKWDEGDGFRVSGDLQYVDSDTSFTDPTGFGTTTGGFNFLMDLTGDLPTFTVTPDDFLTNPDNYTYQALMSRSAENTGSETAARLDLEWDFDEGSVFRSFTSGVRYTTKDIETADSGFDWQSISGPPWDGSDIATAEYNEFPEYYALDPYQDDFFRGDGATANFGPHFVVDPALLAMGEESLVTLANLNPLSGAVAGFTPFDEFNTQEEETLAAYGMLKFGNNAVPTPYDGNIGLRVVQTKVVADGTQTLTYRDPSDTGTDIQSVSDISVEQDYIEFLPSMNIRFFLQDDLQLRVAASRGLSRPSFYDLRGNFSLSQNYYDADNDPSTAPVLQPSQAQAYTGSGGNPGLKPLVVDQYDVSLEHYWKEGSIAYMTLFRKNVHNFIQNGVYTTDFDVPGYGSQEFTVSAPVNGEDGTIQGFEVGMQTFFDMLPAPLNGLGLQANYTYVDSEAPSPSAVDAVGNPLLVPLEGLSENSYNLVGLYEQGPISARLAYNWRDDFVRTTSGNGTGNLPIYDDAYGTLDGSVSYQLNDNLNLSLDAVNMLDEIRYTYQGFENRPRDYVINDRRISIRLRATY
ncbi:TonB-dependent receptor [Parvularcula sp. LCG005]|uniref:TonB-dependent receptor n=1 Tax=Parvularcula sp. LCG005 TaxID=3078805 RepID=UPI002941C162|nr:TonB-dependent receptor [Parvularcula sp. LCG005]WOI52164.1 TonB-dependent receptor [Parvularcula sp. LCG005]